MPGQFTVTQTTTSSTDTVVSYSVQVGSTATAGGVDYTTLSGTVTILAGADLGGDRVTGIIDDTIVEGRRDGDRAAEQRHQRRSADQHRQGADTATVTIFDNDTATVSIARRPTPTKPGRCSGQFTVTQTTTSSTDTVVSYSVQVGSTATVAAWTTPRSAAR